MKLTKLPRVTLGPKCCEVNSSDASLRAFLRATFLSSKVDSRRVDGFRANKSTVRPSAFSRRFWDRVDAKSSVQQAKASKTMYISEKNWQAYLIY